MGGVEKSNVDRATAKKPDSLSSNNSFAEKGDQAALPGDEKGSLPDRPTDAQKDNVFSKQSTKASSNQHAHCPVAHLEKSRSYGDGHGFTCIRHEQDHPPHDEESGSRGNDERKHSEVRCSCFSESAS